MSGEKKESKNNSPSRIGRRRQVRSSIKITRDLFKAVIAGEKETVENLLSHDFGDVNAIEPGFSDNDYSGKNLLMTALLHGRFDIAKLLIEMGAKLDVQNDNGETALMFAVRKAAACEDCYDVVQLLIEKKANLNIQNNQGETALMLASDKEGENFPVTELLVRSGADMGILDEHGNNVLTLALSGEEFIKARFFLQRVELKIRQQLIEITLEGTPKENDKLIEFLGEELEAVNYEIRRKEAASYRSLQKAMLPTIAEEWDLLDSKESSGGPSSDSPAKRVVRTHSSPHKSPNKRKRKAEEGSASVSSDGATSLEELSSEEAAKPIVRTHSSPHKSPHRRKREAEKESPSDGSSTCSTPSENSTHKKARDVTDFWLRRNQVGLDEGLMLAEQATGIVVSENSQSRADRSTNIKAGSSL